MLVVITYPRDGVRCARQLTARAYSTVAGLACLLLLACATRPVGDKNLLVFLDRSGVTRDEVYRKLGKPHATYERNSIAAFHLNEIPTGYYVSTEAPGWEGVRYDLLVEFDAHDVVQSHRLIMVRTQ
jgi:hypothetical protein